MKDEGEGWSETLRPVRPRPRPVAARRWGAPPPAELEDGPDIRALVGAIGYLQQSVDELRAHTEAVESRTATLAAALDALRRYQLPPADPQHDVEVLCAAVSEAVRTSLHESIQYSIYDAIQDAVRSAVRDTGAAADPPVSAPPVPAPPGNAASVSAAPESGPPTPRPTPTPSKKAPSRKGPSARTPRAAAAKNAPAPPTAARRRAAG